MLARRLKSLVRYANVRVTEDEWDTQYASGEWARLWRAEEAPHHLLVAGILNVLQPQSILDVGCGEGALKAQLGHLEYDRYCGIDVSEVAIASAIERDPDPRAEYLCVEAQDWLPHTEHDVLLFVESLYYLEDPAPTVERYIAAARARHVVVSLFRKGRPKLLWRELQRAGLTDPIFSFAVDNRRGKTWDLACYSGFTRPQANR
jgi:2-polyprenyl-3-methyl-5-hydroxy-6-metoxy-1,4-benzoquinol methylase